VRSLRPGFRAFRRTLSRIGGEFFAHAVPTQAAALAFYALFSLAPLLLVVIFIAGLVWGADAVQGRIVGEFGGMMGSGAAEVVQGLLRKVSRPREGGFASVLGFLTIVVGATGVFIQLQGALNTVWDVRPEPGHGFAALLRKRLLSFSLLLVVGFLLLVSLALSAALTALGQYIDTHSSIPAGYLQAAETLLSFTVITLLLATIYRWLPDAEIQWRDVWIGSLVTALLICAGKWGISLYLGRTAVTSAYGAAGSVVIILLWVYYVSLLLLIGAEFTHVHTLEFREAVRPPSPWARRAASGRLPT